MGSEREKGVGVCSWKPEFLRQEESRSGRCCRWPPFPEPGFSRQATGRTWPSSAEGPARTSGLRGAAGEDSETGPGLLEGTDFSGFASRAAGSHRVPQAET